MDTGDADRREVSTDKRTGRGVARAGFLLGGVLLLVYSGLLTLEVVTSTGYRTVGGLVATAGGLVAFVGLVALYPRYADRSRWLARSGLTAAIVGGIGYGIVTVMSAAELLGLVAGSEGGPGAVFVLVVVGMVLGFGLFAAASYRAGAGTGGLTPYLLGPVVVFVVIVATGAAGLTSVALSAVLAFAHAVTYLAIGWALSGETTPALGGRPTPDSAT